MFIDYFLQEIYIYFILILLGYIYYLNLYINKNNNKNNIKKIRYNNKNFPPYFPNQWYFIDFSNNIKNKEIKRYSILDKEIIVFRTETNKIGILNAFCPHMGTHLIDGKVEKETIICPYHEWSFNINGECKNIPYTKSKITNRCNAKIANGCQCTRQRKDNHIYCGTHEKGTPHGVIDEGSTGQLYTKHDVFVQEVNGIVQYLDKQGNVYNTEHIQQDKENPEIIGRYLVDSDGTYQLNIY